LDVVGPPAALGVKVLPEEADDAGAPLGVYVPWDGIPEDPPDE